MKFDTKLKLEKIASTDETRHALTTVFHDKEANSLVATNGHMLVKIPVTENEHDDRGCISAESIVAARKAKANAETPDLTFVGGKISVPAKDQTFGAPDYVHSEYPAYQRVVPNFDALNENVATIALDAKYLLQLAEAIRSDKSTHVVLSFELGKTFGPILVRSTVDSDTAMGVLMPVRHNENKGERVSKTTAEKLEASDAKTEAA